MLQRATFPSGSKGLMLHPADTEEGKRVRARAGSVRILGETLQQTCRRRRAGEDGPGRVCEPGFPARCALLTQTEKTLSKHTVANWCDDTYADRPPKSNQKPNRAQQNGRYPRMRPLRRREAQNQFIVGLPGSRIPVWHHWAALAEVGFSRVEIARRLGEFLNYGANKALKRLDRLIPNQETEEKSK